MNMVPESDLKWPLVVPVQAESEGWLSGFCMVVASQLVGGSLEYEGCS